MHAVPESHLPEETVICTWRERQPESKIQVVVASSSLILSVPMLSNVYQHTTLPRLHKTYRALR